MPGEMPSPTEPGSVHKAPRLNVMHKHQNGTGATLPGAVPSFAHTVLGAPYEPPLSPEDPDWALHVPAVDLDAKDKGTADTWLVHMSNHMPLLA
eukprot:1147022-Pelagomonas_calceolata.AAC.4